MADEIVNCQIIKDTSNNDAIIKYVLVYKFEDNGNKTVFIATVIASEMTDPSDMDELKTLANAKASTNKQAWLNLLNHVTTTDNTLDGPVTL